MKKVNFVYSRNKLDFKKFTKTSEYDDVVSYHDIITKLVKNDKSNERPSEFVVNSYLRKKIVKAMTDENSHRIIYALKDLNPDIINAIRGLMIECHPGETEFNLTVIQHKKLSFCEDDTDAINSLDWLTNFEFKEV